jgi:hypothetical protein
VLSNSGRHRLHSRREFATLPGSVSFENKINGRGERYVWLEPRVVDRLRALRGPGESYSDVILRLAGRGDVGRDERAG